MSKVTKEMNSTLEPLIPDTRTQWQITLEGMYDENRLGNLSSENFENYWALSPKLSQRNRARRWEIGLYRSYYSKSTKRRIWIHIKRLAIDFKRNEYIRCLRVAQKIGQVNDMPVIVGIKAYMEVKPYHLQPTNVEEYIRKEEVKDNELVQLQLFDT